MHDPRRVHRPLKALSARHHAGKGLRLRISGLNGVPALTGSGSWRTVSVEFSVAETDPILVLELRAQSGQAWFDRNSLTLTRIP